MANKVNVVMLPERLDRFIQPLIKGGFRPIKIGKREAGPGCYLIAAHASDVQSEVEGAVKQAGMAAGFVLEGVQAGRRHAEAPWQVDFVAPTLMDSEDGPEDMTRFLHGGMPGYAEIERAGKIKAAMLRRGLPVTKVDITPTLMFWNVGGTGRNAHYLRYNFYLNRKLKRVTKDTANLKAKAVLEELGIEVIGVRIILDGVSDLSIRIELEPLSPFNDDHITFESENFDQFVNKAVELTPAYGDEMRMRRLGAYLKSKGWKFEYLELSVNAPTGWENTDSSTYGVASYVVGRMIDPTRRKYSNWSQATMAAMSALSNFTWEDNKLTGHPYVSPSHIHVDGDLEKGLIAWFRIQSFKSRAEVERGGMDKSLDWSQLQEGEDDLDQYVSKAMEFPHLRTSVFITDLTNELKAQGLPLYARISFRTDFAYKVPNDLPLNINVYLKSYYDNGEAVNQAVAEGQIRAALVKLGRQALPQKSYKGNDIVIKSRDPISIWYSMVVSGFELLQPPEDGGWIRESEEDLDTEFGIGERERLHRLVGWLTKFLSPVLWATAEPARDDSGRAPESVFVRVRMMDSVHCATEFNMRLLRSMYAYDIVEPLNDPSNNRQPDLHASEQDPTTGIWDVTMFLAPVNKPMSSKIYVDGPALETNRHVQGVEPPDGIIESEDPDIEMIVRHVAEKTPGYLDRERLKAAIKALADNGIEVLWIRQFSKPVGHSSASVGVNVLVKHVEPTPRSTTLPTYQRDKIGQVLRAYWEIEEGVFFDYQNDDGNRVFEWVWLSHDSPENQIDFTLRAPNWDAESRQLLKSIETNMVLETGDFEPDMGQYVNAAITPMQDQINVMDLAKALEAEGFVGKVVFAYTGSGVPYVQTTIWVPLESASIPVVREKLKRALASSVFFAQRAELASRSAEINQSSQGHYHVSFVTAVHVENPNPDERFVTKFGESMRKTIEMTPPLTEAEPNPDEFMRQANADTIWDNRSRIMGMANYLNERGYIGYLRVSEPSWQTDRKDNYYTANVFGRLTRKDRIIGHDDMRGDISAALEATGVEYPLGKGFIGVNYNGHTIDDRYPEPPWHHELQFQMIVSKWREMGDVDIHLPGPEFTVDIKI